MASAKLHASADFFKQLSLEFQQLNLVIQALETFVFRASVRGRELGDNRLLLILNQLDEETAKNLKVGERVRVR